MSYVVNIIRIDSTIPCSEDGIDEESWMKIEANPPIRIAGEEIDELVDGDDALMLEPCETGKEIVWTGHPEGKKVFLSFQNGIIDATSPDNKTMVKLVEIAKKLDARLVGEEGEFLDNDDWENMPDTKGCGWTCLVIIILAIVLTGILIYLYR